MYCPGHNGVSNSGDKVLHRHQAPLPHREDHHQDPSLMDHRQDLEPDLGQSQLAPLPLQAEKDQHPIATDHHEVEDQRQDAEPELAG